MNAFAIHPDTRLGLIHLNISDPERATRFYCDVLGFAVLERRENTLWLTADGKTPLLALTAINRALPRTPQTAGLYHFAILVPGRFDLALALHHILEMHYPLQGASDHLVSEALYLADPDGNGIEIYADRAPEEWIWDHGHVQMDTNALDLDFLLAELGRGKVVWERLNPETRIGHVHLQILNLRECEDFYRQVLGLRVRARYGMGAVFLAAGDYHHHVGLNNWEVASGAVASAEVAGLRYFTLRLPDEEELRRVANNLNKLGMGFESSPGMLKLQDPGGNTVVVSVGQILPER